MLQTLNSSNAEQLVSRFYAAKKLAGSIIAKGEGKSDYTDMSPSWSSNENNCYMRNLMKGGESVLAIAGSFDHIVDFVLYGAKNVYAVDVNPLQFPIDWIKYWAIQELSDLQKYEEFAINPQTKNMLSNQTIERILQLAEDATEKDFWRKVIEEKSAMDIRMQYLLGEDRFIINRSYRVAKFEYLTGQNFRKVKRLLKEANIFLKEDSIYEVNFAEETFDIIHMSNLHNFEFADEYIEKLKKCMRYLKVGGSVIIYCIGMKPEWFEAVDRCQMIPIRISDINPNYMQNQTAMIGIQQQIQGTMQIYNTLKQKYRVTVKPVPTAKGYAMYNTSTDVVLIVQK